MAHRWKTPKSKGQWKFAPRPGGWMVAERPGPNGTTERRRLFLSEKKGKISLSLNGSLWQGEWIASRQGTASSKADLQAALTAQFPGKVRKILVSADQSVELGQKLILVEAMKMEFAVLAPKAGKIRGILVKDGQAIMPGDCFLEME